jgi:putative heme degradation protein
MVTSLECYDAGGTLLLRCFGKRMSGAPEPTGWRALLAPIPRLEP